MLRIVAASSLGMVGFYSLFVWVPAQLRATGRLPWALELNVLVMTWWSLCVVGGGLLADHTPTELICRRGRAHCGCPPLGGLPLVATAGAVAVALLAPCLFASLEFDCTRSAATAADANTNSSDGTATLARPHACEGESVPMTFFGLLALTVTAFGLYVGPLQAWFVLSLRSTHSRYSALGVAYNLGAALFAGTTPLIATLLATSPIGTLGAGAYLSLAASVSAATVAGSERCAPLTAADTALLRARSDPADRMAQGVELVGVDESVPARKLGSEAAPPSAV